MVAMRTGQKQHVLGRKSTGKRWEREAPTRLKRKMAKHTTYRDAIQRIYGAPNAKTQRTRILRLLIDARGGRKSCSVQLTKQCTPIG